MKFPAETRDAQELDALVSEAEAAVSVARSVIANSTGMDQRAFESLAQKVEAAVWLVGSATAAQICEIQPDGSAEYRAATADEVTTGVFYADRAAYDASKVAA
jgi:hypothetical protein